MARGGHFNLNMKPLAVKKKKKYDFVIFSLSQISKECSSNYKMKEEVKRDVYKQDVEKYKTSCLLKIIKL